MIVVDIMGIDTILAISEEKKVHQDLANIYGIDEEDLIFRALDGFIIHNGVEQTSFLLDLKIQAPSEYIKKEEEVKAYLFNAFKDVSIHKRILFAYFDEERETIFKDEDYPLYMSDKNVVHIQHENEEDYDNYEETHEEPYMGEILSEFDNYIKEHPNADEKEVYEVLTGIREKVTENKHQHKH